MYKQITVQTLFKQGVSKSEIARQLGCHRHTVTRILKRQEPLEKQTRNKTSMLDQFQKQIANWLEEKLSRRRIYEKLQTEYDLHASYINICKYMQKHFPKPVAVYGVQLTAPGEEAELDFGYLGRLPGKDGKLVKTWGIAIVLSYSRAAYYGICYDQKLETLIAEVQKAFAYFNGVPKKLKVDNMKTAVICNRRFELEFNQEFLEFAHHYNVVVVPCTPYSPEQKGKVEAGVKYLQGNFVSGREFANSDDLTHQLQDWMRNYANQRVHGTTRRVPWQELLEKERSSLQCLPSDEFSFFARCVRKVQPNCHINVENVYYSVPFHYAGQDVTVRFNEHLIRVIDKAEQIALHARSFEEGTYVTVRAHLPSWKVYSETEHQAKVEEQMRAIGTAAHEYFHMLLQAKPGYWKQTVRGVLGLAKKYSAEEVNLSLIRALHYRATDVPRIRHILEKKLYLLPLEPILPKTADEKPVGARELTYYTVYDAHTVPVPA